MEEYRNVTLHPAFRPALQAVTEKQTEQLRAKAVLLPAVFERVKTIVEREEFRKQAAFYGTIAEAAAGGADFSAVESIRDIGDVYARYIVGRTYDE